MRPTNLLYWLLFPWLSEAEPLFPGFGLDTLRPGGHVGEHGLGLSGGVGGALAAASFHAVVPVHGGPRASLHSIGEMEWSGVRPDRLTIINSNVLWRHSTLLLQFKTSGELLKSFLY